MPSLRDDQRARACRAVCEAAGLRTFWTWNGPTARADVALRAKGGVLSRGQQAALRVAWGVWNGRGELTVAELLESLAPHVLRVVGAFLGAAGSGPESVERFLCDHGQPPAGPSVGDEAAGDGEPETGGRVAP